MKVFPLSIKKLEQSVRMKSFFVEDGVLLELKLRDKLKPLTGIDLFAYVRRRANYQETDLINSKLEYLKITDKQNNRLFFS